ncbi:MAG: two-component system, NarL family, invasion response regulator UvrY [Methyloprofundus sp.]|nr:MAG: two-component system, NarL family, invasion response regulator UvrY [Methyloprofundus sp.]
MTIKVILVDDHAVVRAGVKMLLSTDERLVVIAEAERGEQAMQLYAKQQPDVLVMDLSMPGIGGLETIRRLCARHKTAKILVFSVHAEHVYISRAMQAGAKGFVNKGSVAEVLIEAIVKIAQGDTFLEDNIESIQLEHEKQQQTDQQAIIRAFTPREFDVFLLLSKGMAVQKIADELCLSYKTIANYSTQVKKKLSVDNVAELAHIAVSYGMINL